MRMKIRLNGEVGNGKNKLIGEIVLALFDYEDLKIRYQCRKKT